MRARDANPVFESIAESLSEVAVVGQRGRLLILEEDASALLDSAEGEVPARLLPQFDALIMGHKDKTRFIDPEARSRIFLPRADVAATMLVDGRVQGVWTLKKGRRAWRLELSPFSKLPRERVEEVEAEVDRMQRFTGFEIELVWKKA